MVARNTVVDEARKWVGTPYHHDAAVMGHGVDCARLLIEVYAETGVIGRFHPGRYRRDWHLHRSEEVYLGFVESLSNFVVESNGWDPGLVFLPGQILTWKVGRAYSHGAIATGPTTFVHASYPSGVVEEVSIKGCFLERRRVRIYDFGAVV